MESEATLYDMAYYEFAEFTEIEIPSELERQIEQELQQEETPVLHERRGRSGTTGYWDKYGGRRMSLFQPKIVDTWYCQSCNIPQPKELPPYMVEYPEKEYIRVCAICISTNCAALRKRVG